MLNTEIIQAIDAYAVARIALHNATGDRQTHHRQIDVNSAFSLLDSAINEYAGKATARVIEIREKDTFLK